VAGEGAGQGVHMWPEGRAGLHGTRYGQGRLRYSIDRNPKASLVLNKGGGAVGTQNLRREGL